MRLDGSVFSGTLSFFEDLGDVLSEILIKVVDASTGKPMEGARVSISRGDYKVTKNTNFMGQAWFGTPLYVGPFYVAVDKIGYVGKGISGLQSSTAGPTPAAIVVELRPEKGTVSVKPGLPSPGPKPTTITPRASFNATVQVVDEMSRGVAGATVFLMGARKVYGQEVTNQVGATSFIDVDVTGTVPPLILRVQVGGRTVGEAPAISPFTKIPVMTTRAVAAHEPVPREGFPTGLALGIGGAVVVVGVLGYLLTKK
jgi:hypothetical protein